MIVTFQTLGAIVGIESVWEGNFVNGAWVPVRNLNGDDSNQGRSLRLLGRQLSQRVHRRGRRGYSRPS